MVLAHNTGQSVRDVMWCADEYPPLYKALKFLASEKARISKDR